MMKKHGEAGSGTGAAVKAAASADAGEGAGAEEGAGAAASEEARIELKLKWGGKTYLLTMLASETVEDLQYLIEMETGVRPARQKLFGLKLHGKATSAPPADAQLGADLGVRPGQTVKMMGSADDVVEGMEEAAAAGAAAGGGVLDDFLFDYVPDAETRLQLADARAALDRTASALTINVMNPVREGKKLLVLDLDHTLLDFSSKHDRSMEELKRPYMDSFLATVYRHYDLVVWSQTRWHWIEVKLTELGMITNPEYHIAFALDRSCMFKVTREYKGQVRRHEVKALELIWRKYPQWSPANTVHIDDLARNFAMNPASGLQCTCYKRKRSRARHDVELLQLAAYLEHIAEKHDDFTQLDHAKWEQRVEGLIDRQKRREGPQ